MKQRHVNAPNSGTTESQQHHQRKQQQKLQRKTISMRDCVVVAVAVTTLLLVAVFVVTSLYSSTESIKLTVVVAPILSSTLPTMHLHTSPRPIITHAPAKALSPSTTPLAVRFPPPPPTLLPLFVNSVAQQAIVSSRAATLTNFINSIKLSDGTLTEPLSYTPINASSSASSIISAEQAALSWLVWDDPLQLWPNSSATNQSRLQQRYALLTYGLQMRYFNATLFGNDECEWLFVRACTKLTDPSTLDVANVVTSIYPDGMARQGSTLSPDLGLLSNLVQFYVSYVGLMGSLPSLLGTTWTNLKTMP